MEEALGTDKKTDPTARLRLGDLLVHRGLITPQALQDALKAQRGTGKRLGEVLVDRGALTEVELTPLLAQHLKLTYIDVLNRHRRVSTTARSPRPQIYGPAAAQ